MTTTEEVIRLARAAGLEHWWDIPNATEEGYQLALINLINLAKCQENEACAKVCERLCDEDEYCGHEAATAIRARMKP